MIGVARGKGVVGHVCGPLTSNMGRPTLSPSSFGGSADRRERGRGRDA